MDRLPEENGDDPQGLTRQAAPPRPGGGAQDAMALLRQASQYHQAKQGNVSTPEIEANKQAMAANSEAIHALKYSVHGIPEGINHVDELERLKGLINTNQATANDLDNFITLEQFMKEQAARTEGGADHGAHQPGTAPAPVSAGPEKSEVPPPAGAARSVRSQSSGAGQPAGGPRMDRGQVSSPRVQPAARAGGGARGPQPAMEEKPAAKPAVKGKASSGNMGPTMEQLQAPNPYKKPASAPRMSEVKDGSVKTYHTPSDKPAGFQLSSGNYAFEAGDREHNMRKAYQSGDREGGRLMVEYTGAKDPAAARMAAAEEDSGRIEVNLPKIVRTGGGPYAGGVILGELSQAAGRAGLKASQRVGAGMETAKTVATSRGKSPSLGEPTMRPATGKAPAIMQEGTPQVGPRPEPRKINVDARPRQEAPAPKESFTRPPAPKRTEGYSVNTQTPAAQKRNSMNKSQRAADANKKGAAEAKTEKAAGKPKAPKTEKIADKPKRPKK